MTIEQAATLMGVSTRHTRRILAASRSPHTSVGDVKRAAWNRSRQPVVVEFQPLQCIQITRLGRYLSRQLIATEPQVFQVGQATQLSRNPASRLHDRTNRPTISLRP